MFFSSPLSGFARLAWFATALALVVVVFGAFVRLSNAGLSCPDWPTCYGKIGWPTEVREIAAANAAFPDRPVENSKTWREQGHRMLAGTLILATFTLGIWAWRRRNVSGQPLRTPLLVAALIVFQALLGMWTVTWKLKPIVVLAHLLAGMTTFWLLAYCALCASEIARIEPIAGRKLRRMALFGVMLLVAQIALGGWTSSNYAALACGTDFPLCQGEWWPKTDFQEGFVLWRGLGFNYEGGVLDGPARTAIHLAHRLGALLVFGHLLGLAIVAIRGREAKLGLTIAGLLLLQIGLGISNVVFALPLTIATAHNATAALLMFALLIVLARTRAESTPYLK